MANRILPYVVSQREAIDEGNSSVHAWKAHLYRYAHTHTHTNTHMYTYIQMQIHPHARTLWKRKRKRVDDQANLPCRHPTGEATAAATSVAAAAASSACRMMHAACWLESIFQYLG